MTIPLVRNPRPSRYGALFGALLGLVLVNLSVGSAQVRPNWQNAELSPDRLAITTLALAAFGWLGGVVWASFQGFLTQRGKRVVLACGLVAMGLLLLPNLPLVVPWKSQPLGIAGLFGFLVGRTGMMSASVVGGILGLGIGLLEGHFLRKTAPVASRAETELLVVWGMVSVILGLIVFEILYVGFMAFNAMTLIGATLRYPYPIFTLLKFYYLSLGSYLGLSVMLLVVNKGSAPNGTS
jgi:hypothetical protein